MQTIAIKVTVFFESPFWIGLCERITDGKQLEVCKITFGSEPKDYEVHQFLIQNWKHLQFSPPVAADKSSAAKINPKRMQRSIRKQLKQAAEKTIGTKSQQALNLQHEEIKATRKHRKKENRLEKKQKQFELRQQKKKEKHRGR